MYRVCCCVLFVVLLCVVVCLIVFSCLSYFGCCLFVFCAVCCVDVFFGGRCRLMPCSLFLAL